MTKNVAIVVSDGSLESAALVAVAKAKHDVVVLDASPDDRDRREAANQQAQWARADIVPATVSLPGEGVPDRLTFLTSTLAAAAVVAKEKSAATVFLPLQAGLASPDFARAAEWVQIAEDLLLYGLGLEGVSLQAPLLELEAWQVLDLAEHTDAPLHPSHVQAGQAIRDRASPAAA